MDFDDFDEVEEYTELTHNQLAVLGFTPEDITLPDFCGVKFG